MAGIDYTIPGQIRPIQVESPMNAMAQAMQLRNLQNQNALADYQLGAAQRAETKETNRMRLLGEAGDDETAVANALLKSGDVAGYSAYVKAAEDRRTQKLTQTKTTGDIVTTRLSQFKDLLNTINPDAPDAGAKYLAWHEANHADEYIGPLLARRGVTADQSRASIDAAIQQGPAAVAELINRSRLGIDKFRENQKAEAKELRERAEKLYPAYQLSEYEAGNEPLTLDEFVAQRMQTTAAPTTTAPAVAAPAPEFVGEGGAVTTLPDGDKGLTPVTKTEKKMPSAFGSDVHPLVPSLIAAGNKDMATVVQEGHKASGALRQINDSFKELDRLETEKPKGWEARSKALRDYIKVVSTEGPGTRVKVGVKLSEQEKGFEGDLGKGQAKRVLEDKDKAEDARDMLSTVSIGRDILKSGAITGAGADFFVGFNQALKTAGIDAGYADASANSQAYSANMAQNVGKLIKLFGAGTGLSDADRAYAEKMAGGKIALDRKALEKILDITERASRNVIKRYNKNVKGIKTNIPLEVELDEEPAAAPRPPAVGTVKDGYKFNGGNPADKNNWEKVK
jgi:hypothetical protein